MRAQSQRIRFHKIDRHRSTASQHQTCNASLNSIETSQVRELALKMKNALRGYQAEASKLRF